MQETVSGSGICKSAPCSRETTTPAPHHSVFYRPDALPAAQPTASKHWRQINMHNGLQKLNLSGKKGVKWTGRPAAKQWVSVCSHIRHCSFLAADQLAMMLHKTARSTISLDCVHENLVVTQLVSGTTTGLLSTHNMAEITKTWSGLMNWPSTPSVDISKRRRRHH